MPLYLTNFVQITKLPKQNEQLLVKIDLLAGPRQKRLRHRVIQETTEALQNETKVLVTVYTRDVTDEKVGV